MNTNEVEKQVWFSFNRFSHKCVVSTGNYNFNNNNNNDNNKTVIFFMICVVQTNDESKCCKFTFS